MPTAITLNAPATSSTVITQTSGSGAMGRANNYADQAAFRLLNAHENFRLHGDGYETRAGKFWKTWSAFTRASASVGAATGVATMFVPDVVTGRGTQRAQGEPGSMMDEGVAGNVARGATMVAAGAAEVGGAIAGGTVGLVGLPAKTATTKTTAQWMESSSTAGANALGQTTAHAVGTAAGVGLSAARIPSVAVKYTLAGAFAVGGGIVGFFAGAVRAIFNV